MTNTSIHLYGGGWVLDQCLCYLQTLHTNVLPVVVTSSRLISSFSNHTTLASAGSIYICNEITDYINLLSSSDVLPPSFIIACGPDTGFSEELLAKVKYGVYSLHPVSSDRYLGGAHETWQILNNENETGYSIQQINSSIDGSQNPFIRSTYTPLLASDTPESIHKKNNVIGYELLTSLIRELLVNPSPPCYSALKKEITYSLVWPRLNTVANGWINWNWSTSHIIQFLKAFGAPYPGASTFFDNSLVRLDYIETIDNCQFHPYSSGVIVQAFHDISQVLVVTLDGIILLKYYLNDDNTAIPQPGYRFITPIDHLEGSLQIPIVSAYTKT
ncbi:hypothetical protein N8657_00915 [bacterium]|nr:hypothetical protein [bacterium]